MHRKLWMLGILLCIGSVFAGCGCGSGQTDENSNQVIKITITPEPSPTPSPEELNPDAVVSADGLTMVNEYLVQNGGPAQGNSVQGNPDGSSLEVDSEDGGSGGDSQDDSGTDGQGEEGGS